MLQFLVCTAFLLTVDAVVRWEERTLKCDADDCQLAIRNNTFKAAECTLNADSRHICNIECEGADRDSVISKSPTTNRRCIRNLGRAQQELMKGCEDIEGIELALCIVDRYASDLQTKQNERLTRLKSMAVTRKDESDFFKNDEPIKGMINRKGENAFGRQRQKWRKQQFGVNFSNAYRTRRRHNYDSSLLER
ncbi:unnamed protein product [Cylicocyclus nassatus]|uniref:Uncharacterized protein n=1 Tax=Cylicocyclus nassatus TaxID=53992 RepID=A0AA36H5C6_CYLNA|nr:unnamed protein product [Cylicocyclus nassatus]